MNDIASRPVHREEPGATDDVDLARLTGNVAAFESASGLPHEPVLVAVVVVLVAVGHTALMGVRRMARVLRGQR